MKRFSALIGILSLSLAACSPAPATPAPAAASSSSVAAAPVAMERLPVASSSAAAQSSAAGKPVAKAPASSAASSKAKAPARSAATTDAEWKTLLTADQYAVLREAGTETPFSSDLVNEHRKGTFVTADCGDPVFRSEQKFDSGTGWPSFWAPISKGAVSEKTDNSGGMQRTEVLSKCGGHLGHVFTDGPQPTGLRYCMNGLALRFIPDADQTEQK